MHAQVQQREVCARRLRPADFGNALAPFAASMAGHDASNPLAVSTTRNEVAAQLSRDPESADV
eukprot:16059-Eustigmatos_ZCMA.PRE.1